MLETKSTTIQTYNASAKALAARFDGMPARIPEIESLFRLIQKPNPHVLEIGCGSGRDAAEIIKRTRNYTGMDVSENLIAIARQKSPQAHFEVADIETYNFPPGLDIVIAFASLLHSPKHIVQNILKKSHAALNKNGLVYLSLKTAYAYQEQTFRDVFGTRTYYFYSQHDISEMIKGYFDLTTVSRQIRDDQPWLETLLTRTQNS